MLGIGHNGSRIDVLFAASDWKQLQKRCLKTLCAKRKNVKVQGSAKENNYESTDVQPSEFILLFREY
jgi:predicted nucleotidyltransferase